MVSEVNVESSTLDGYDLKECLQTGRIIRLTSWICRDELVPIQILRVIINLKHLLDAHVFIE